MARQNPTYGTDKHFIDNLLIDFYLFTTEIDFPKYASNADVTNIEYLLSAIFTFIFSYILQL